MKILLNFLYQAFGNLLFTLRKGLKRSRIERSRNRKQRDLNKVFTQMGKDLYQLTNHGTTCREELKTHCLKISALEEELHYADKKIDAINATRPTRQLTRKTYSYVKEGGDSISCPSCRSILPTSSKYCANCRYSFEETSTKP